jgi:hypothetical protein
MVPPTPRATDEPGFEESVTVTTAATPLLIEFEFKPVAKHMVEPLPGTHVTVFDAAVRAAPAETVRDVTLLAG